MTLDSSHSSDDGNALPDSLIKTADSLIYWNSVSADVNGMLGGYPQVSRIDLQGSKNFIGKLKRLGGQGSRAEQQPQPKRLKLAVDCGAGIGRITEGMLIQVCDVVDVVEPIAKFTRVLEESQSKKDGKVGDVFTIGLEEWQPSKKYDLIWNQWCLGHLTDAQLVAYLKKAGRSLANGGWIVVKENLSSHKFGDDWFDELDSSVTRSDQKFRDLFLEAGLSLVKAELQAGFPKGLGLYPVKMYALRPT